jgi:hypothetical protein
MDGARAARRNAPCRHRASRGACLFFALWRHHPPDALRCSLLLAVVRTKVSTSPSADGAAAAALDVVQNFISLEPLNRQLALMMTRPIAFAFAKAIDKQLANPVSAN